MSEHDDVLERAEKAGALMLKGIFAVIQREMLRNLDVTDDTLARAAIAFIDHHAPPKNDFSVALRTSFSPAKVVDITRKMAGDLRRSAATSVAAAIEEDPGVDESSLGEFVEMVLRQRLSFARDIEPGFGTIMARAYAAMLRRSGMHPRAWAEAFVKTVDEGWWAVRR